MGVYLIAIFLGVALGFFHKGLESTVSRPRKFWFWGILVVLVVIIGFLAVLLADPFMPGLRLRWYLDALHNNDVEKFLLGLILGILIYLVLARLRREYGFKISDHGYLVAAVMVTLFFAGVFLPDLTDQASRILNIKTPLVEASFATAQSAQAKLIGKERGKSTKGEIRISELEGLKRTIFSDEAYSVYVRALRDPDFDFETLAKRRANIPLGSEPIPVDESYQRIWNFIDHYMVPLGDCVDTALSQGENRSVIQHRLAPYVHVLEDISLKFFQKDLDRNHNHAESPSLSQYRELLRSEKIESLMSFGNDTVALRNWCDSIPTSTLSGDAAPEVENTDLLNGPYFHLAAAVSLRFLEQPDRAMRILNLTSDRFPDSINAYFHLGNILFEQEREIEHVFRNYRSALNLAISRSREMSSFLEQGRFKNASQEARDDVEGVLNRYRFGEVVLKSYIADAISTGVTRGEIGAKKLSPTAVELALDFLKKAEKLRETFDFGELRWIDLKRQGHYTVLVDEAIRENPNFKQMRFIRRSLEGLEVELVFLERDNIRARGHVDPTGDRIRHILRKVRSDLTQAKALVGE